MTFQSWQCPTHPDERRCRTDGTCASCFADALAAEYVPRKPRDPKAEPRPLEAALSRVSRETE